jgi:hypothetical protein
MMEIKIPYSESCELLKTIPHSSCRNAIENNWLINDAGKIKAHSICWLFCWAKTGMNSKKTELESKKVFDKIFGEMAFQNFDTHVEHEWARWARYQYENINIEKQLMAKINETCPAHAELAEFRTVL